MAVFHVFKHAHGHLYGLPTNAVPRSRSKLAQISPAEFPLLSLHNNISASLLNANTSSPQKLHGAEYPRLFLSPLSHVIAPAKPHSAPQPNGQWNPNVSCKSHRRSFGCHPLTVVQHRVCPPRLSSPSREWRSSPRPSVCAPDGGRRCGTPRSCAPSWGGQTRQ